MPWPQRHLRRVEGNCEWLLTRHAHIALWIKRNLARESRETEIQGNITWAADSELTSNGLPLDDGAEVKCVDTQNRCVEMTRYTRQLT